MRISKVRGIVLIIGNQPPTGDRCGGRQNTGPGDAKAVRRLDAWPVAGAVVHPARLDQPAWVADWSVVYTNSFMDSRYLRNEERCPNESKLADRHGTPT